MHPLHICRVLCTGHQLVCICTFLCMPWGNHNAKGLYMQLNHHWMWSRVVAKFCYPFPNPNRWNQEYPAEPRWPGPNKNLHVVALVSHVETAQLGLVGCSLMLYFNWWRDDAGPHWPQLQHTPCCTEVQRNVQCAAYVQTRDRRGWGYV